MSTSRLGLTVAATLVMACAARPTATESSGADASADASGTTVASDSVSETASSSSDSDSSGDGDSSSGDGDGTPQCVDDADCRLVDDCCMCAAFPDEFEPPPCPEDCFVSSCTAVGMHDARASCRLGACRIAAVSCDPAQVWCNVPAPDCAPGWLPRVADGCWDGCVESRHCDVVPACTDIVCGEGWTCIESQAGAFAPHCEPRPGTCGPTATWCECFAPYPEVCQGGCEEGFSGGVICVDGG